jgi:hypothetical protein
LSFFINPKSINLAVLFSPIKILLGLILQC